MDERATGFALPEGPVSSPLLWLGESLGGTEAALSRNFVGDAGAMLSRICGLLGIDRASQRIGNCCACRPPGDWLGGTPRAPWYHDAISHCAVHREPLFAEGHPVVLALGGTALRTALNLHDVRGIEIGNWHGTITRDPTDRFWVVPTFHPSFLQRGAHNLLGTVLWDIQQALDLARTRRAPVDTASLVVDPPLEWFRAWVSMVEEARRQDPTIPISVDVETPDKAGGKDEGEITAEDRSFQILRVNVSCNTEEGLTVPADGGYLDELRRLLTAGPLWLWNKEYDVPRLMAANLLPTDADHRCLDLMWQWHYLQSDLPRGLGFVAPFFSQFGPWKHRADSDPAWYGAVDGLQTHRVGFGILRDLQRLGMLDAAMRHVHAVHHLALKPAQQVGVRIDRERLLVFKSELAEKATDRLSKLQEVFPDALRNLTPKGGLVSRPAENVLHVKASAFTRKGERRKGKVASEIKLDLYKQAAVVERQLEKEVLCCETCGATEVHRKHRCEDRALTPALALRLLPVTRYFWSEPFNPDSWQQVLAYIKWKKHAPGRAKKTHKETTDRETLERLCRTGDPFYPTLLDYRAVQKVKGTYVDGTERRLDDEDRVHPEPSFRPSTGRLSYVNPNITNIVQDRGGQESLAAGFRRCVVAGPACRLLEVDFAGSEAVDVGWFCRDPRYIRLAKLGVHAGLASHILKRPYDPTWSEADIGAYFREIKKSKDDTIQQTYNRAKRFCHGFSYGMTLHGMVLQFPETFPNLKVAEQYADLFRAMAPAVPTWQRQVRELAFKQHYLGGAAHPFGYKHWFWSVFTYKKITAQQYAWSLKKWRDAGRKEEEAPLAIINGQPFKVSLGEDGKRAVAFLPQSTTAGKLKEVLLRLFDPASATYIGDKGPGGRTPLRAPIHDSLFLEIPAAHFDLVASIVCQEMQRPFREMPCPEEWGLGPFLSTGVSAKASAVGGSWGEMQDLSVQEFGVGSDVVVTAAMEEEAEEVSDLGRAVA